MYYICTMKIRRKNKYRYREPKNRGYYENYDRRFIGNCNVGALLGAIISAILYLLHYLGIISLN